MTAPARDGLSAQAPPPQDATGTVVVPFSEAVRTWLRVALLSFGGPAGQIAVMHRILVEE
jgi:chromate transporter